MARLGSRSSATSARPGFPRYYYCPRMYDGCGRPGSNAVSDVLDVCRRENVECLIFARNDDIVVPYEIVD